MDKTVERILQLSSPEAIEAFYDWLFFKWVTLGVVSFFVAALIGLLVWVCYLWHKSDE